ncbi:MAG: TRAM domain-containing protein [Candidatus Woesearchaeota archaeon]
MYEQKSAPVNEGQEYEVEIESVGEKGDGIAKIKGFVLFIPKTQKGDYVKVKVTKVLKSVGFAEVVSKLEKRPASQPRARKFVTVRPEEMRQEYEPEEHYEDTEDFGEDLEEDK